MELLQILYSIIFIIFLEFIFYIADKIISRKRIVSGFVTSVVLGIVVMNYSLGGSLAIFFSNKSGEFSMLHFLQLLFHMFYSFIRGINRISTINRKYGNL